MKTAEHCDLLVVAETLQLPLVNGERVYAHELSRALKLHPGTIVLSALRGPGEPADTADGHLAASRTMLTTDMIRQARRLRPRKVLYIPEASLTLAAVLRARVLSAAFGASVYVLSLQPRTYEGLARAIARMLAPPCVFVPSESFAEQVRDSLGVPAVSVGIGAPDVARFVPATPALRSEARRRLGVHADSCVYLHVGHIQASRNLECLSTLVGDGSEVIVVGSPLAVDRDVKLMLERKSVRVDTGYVACIQDYYHAADVYVFPVESQAGCIDVPVSVLEAMACGLPVASTAFGALPEIVGSHPAVKLVARSEDVPRSARGLAESHAAWAAGTAELVRGRTWAAVSDCILNTMANGT